MFLHRRIFYIVFRKENITNVTALVTKAIDSGIECEQTRSGIELSCGEWQIEKVIDDFDANGINKFAFVTDGEEEIGIMIDLLKNLKEK